MKIGNHATRILLSQYFNRYLENIMNYTWLFCSKYLFRTISCLSLDPERKPLSLNYKLQTIEFKSYLRWKCTSLRKSPQTTQLLDRISS